MYYLLQRECTQQLEAVLEKSVEHLSSIEAQTEPICQFLPDGTLTFINEACCNYFGKSREQLVGNKYMIALISKAISAQFKPLPRLGILYDNESAFLQAYRFFNLSSDLLVIGNFDGYYTDLNANWEKILGYTVKELTAEPFLEFVHPEDRESTQAEMARLIDGLPVIQFNNRYRCKDSSYKWLSWTAQPFLEEGLIYGVARDISNVYEHCLRQQVESVIQQQRHLLGATLERNRQSLNLNEILATTVREVRQLLQADWVLFFRINNDKTGQIVAESAATDWNMKIEKNFPDQEFPSKCYDFYSQGQLRIIPDVAKDDFASCLGYFMQQMDVKSKIVVPILKGQKVI